jgi:large subunit ribosomal protein L19
MVYKHSLYTIYLDLLKQGAKKKFMKIKELVRTIEQAQLKDILPKISIGDTVKVGVLIQEGNKQRVQPYEGTVIAQHRAGLSTTITVRRIFQGIGVERVFTIHSPSIQDIEVIRCAQVRKAKLYYLRNRVGKGTRLKEKFGVNKNI